MTLRSYAVAGLLFLSTVISNPTRIPKCIEDENPFSRPCRDEIELEEGIGLLPNRDVSDSITKLRTLQFADTFTNTNLTEVSPSNIQPFPDYPQGFALSYPGFAYSTIRSNKLLTPSPPDLLITDPSVQSSFARQPGIIRHSNTSSFDLRSIRFACAYELENGSMKLPSCLVTFVCKPKVGKDLGIPSGHRPTPRSMVKNTFEFMPNVDMSSLPWYDPTNTTPMPEPRIKTTLYANANFGDEFYDLDLCYIMLQQYATVSTPNVPPALLIDDVVGVAYMEDQQKA